MKVNISKRCCTVLLLIIAVLYATYLGTLYCQTNRVNVRTEPNTNSEILGRLSINDLITPIDESENWYKINYENEEAWVYKPFFDEEKIETAKYRYNSKSGVLHNSNCKWYGNTKKGYFTDEAVGRDCGLCGAALKGTAETGYKYWINTNFGVRHNRGCRWYDNTKKSYHANGKIGRVDG